MKTTLFLLCLTVFSAMAQAQRKTENNNPLIGSWMFTKQSKTSELQKLYNKNIKQDYQFEYFVFEDNNKFRHEFVDTDGNKVKVLKGKWKITGENKVRIQYSDIDYELNTSFFFLDQNLVLGQHFNHVIFSRDMLDNRNIALK